MLRRNLHGFDGDTRTVDRFVKPTLFQRIGTGVGGGELLKIGSYKDISFTATGEYIVTTRNGRITTPLCGDGGSFDVISSGRTSRIVRDQNAWGRICPKC